MLLFGFWVCLCKILAFLHCLQQLQALILSHLQPLVGLHTPVTLWQYNAMAMQRIWKILSTNYKKPRLVYIQSKKERCKKNKKGNKDCPRKAPAAEMGLLRPAPAKLGDLNPWSMAQCQFAAPQPLSCSSGPGVRAQP